MADETEREPGRTYLDQESLKGLDIVPGGLIRQPLNNDPGTINWDLCPKTTFTIRIVSFEQFRTITGREPPAPPPLPQDSRLHQPGKRNQGGTDGFIISNAEYQWKYPQRGLDSESDTESSTRGSATPEAGKERSPDAVETIHTGIRGWLPGKRPLRDWRPRKRSGGAYRENSAV